MDDERIAFKEVNGKKQTRIPDKVIDILEIEPGNENLNGIGFYHDGESDEVVLRRLDI